MFIMLQESRSNDQFGYPSTVVCLEKQTKNSFTLLHDTFKGTQETSENLLVSWQIVQ